VIRRRGLGGVDLHPTRSRWRSRTSDDDPHALSCLAMNGVFEGLALQRGKRIAVCGAPLRFA